MAAVIIITSGGTTSSSSWTLQNDETGTHPWWRSSNRPRADGTGDELRRVLSSLRRIRKSFSEAAERLARVRWAAPLEEATLAPLAPLTPRARKPRPRARVCSSASRYRVAVPG